MGSSPPLDQKFFYALIDFMRLFLKKFPTTWILKKTHRPPLLQFLASSDFAKCLFFVLKKLRFSLARFFLDIVFLKKQRRFSSWGKSGFRVLWGIFCHCQIDEILLKVSFCLLF